MAEPAASRHSAALWILAGSFAFALVYASGKLAGGAIAALQIVWIRYVSGLVTVGALCAATPGGFAAALGSRRRSLHALRALLGIGGGACTIYAAIHMPLVDAAALSLLQGPLTVALGVLLLRERVGGGQLAAAALCLAGAYIVVRGGSAQAEGFATSALAPWAAILGALFVAGEVILIRVIAQAEHMLASLLFGNGFAALLLAAPVLAFVWEPAAPGTLALLCLLGPLAIAGQMCNLRGFRQAEAAWLAPFGYSAVVFAALIGWVAFGTVPTLGTWAGTGLIVAGGLLLMRR